VPWVVGGLPEDLVQEAVPVEGCAAVCGHAEGPGMVEVAAGR